LTARDIPGEIHITASSGLVLNDPTRRVIITGTPEPEPAGDPAAIHVTATLDTLNPGTCLSA
ncbi:MAG TPA: hypothetical protein QF695_12880, partial [Arenicellales bacterium]|nr:hypothetical protein [Arenicellales bacterium]